GKSTLARHLNALLLPTDGRIFVGGLDTRELKNHARIRNTVGMVFQFPEDQIVSTVVEEDVAFGPANIGLPRAQIHERVESALNRVGLLEYRNRPPHMLSAGQMQRLAIAGVLAIHPRCIVFDEATTMLDPVGRKMVMELMRDLNQDGVTIIFITHHMEEAAQARRMIVMEHGCVAMDGTPESIFAHSADLNSLGLSLPSVTSLAMGLSRIFPAISKGIYREEDLFCAFSEPVGQRREKRIKGNEVGPLPIQIEVSHLEHIYLKGTPLEHKALYDVSLKIGQGVGYGFMGHTGSGKSTVLQHLNAILRPQAGSVRVGSYNLENPDVDRKSVCRLAGLMFQNPEMQFFETYVGDEIAFGVRQFGCETSLAERVRWAMEWVGLEFDLMKDRPTYSLSGGERRKVALACVLAWKPGILLLDEPTAGLDPRSRQEILGRLKQLRNEEVTLVLSSHQMEDMAALVDGAVVFDHGRDVFSGAIGVVYSQEQRLSAVGLEPPLAVRAANRLREKGWDIPDWVIQPEDLICAVEELGE
ncbi:MAG TPA: energy-coupling factor transporter ATPase, partial [Anaerolineaceae bacterium]|nr:energy-coupling factor transporter ATPase [Anaerolineaceae bacterium]